MQWPDSDLPFSLMLNNPIKQCSTSNSYCFLPHSVQFSCAITMKGFNSPAFIAFVDLVN